MKIKARTYLDDQWSALNEVSFRVSEGYGNLNITELQYHPLPGVGVDDKEYEFIELKNTGTVPLDLSGMAFIQGITLMLQCLKHGTISLLSVSIQVN
jgi:hypothetical protein